MSLNRSCLATAFAGFLIPIGHLNQPLTCVYVVHAEPGTDLALQERMAERFDKLCGGSAPMIVATLGIRVPLEKTAEAMGVILPMLGPTRSEAGCVSCDLFSSAEDGSSMVLVERWKSERDFQRHVQSDHYRKVLAWIEMSVAPPEIRFDAVAESHGLEMIETMRGQPL